MLSSESTPEICEFGKKSRKTGASMPFSLGMHPKNHGNQGLSTNIFVPKHKDRAVHINFHEEVDEDFGKSLFGKG